MLIHTDQLSLISKYMNIKTLALDIKYATFYTGDHTYCISVAHQLTIVCIQTQPEYIIKDIKNENSIYLRLKRQIILTEQKPGAVLREREIMKAFNVSRTPVREALMRLEMDGLVRIISNVGTFVEEVSFQQLKDVFETRSYLVKMAGRLAAARITKEELTEIRQRINTMKSAGDTLKLIQLDGEIHTIINKATKNEVLIKILNDLHDQAVRFWAFSGAEGSYWDDLEKEFEDITAALELHDEEMSAHLLGKHTDRFVEHIRSQLTF